MPQQIQGIKEILVAPKVLRHRGTGPGTAGAGPAVPASAGARGPGRARAARSRSWGGRRTRVSRLHTRVVHVWPVPASSAHTRASPGQGQCLAPSDCRRQEPVNRGMRGSRGHTHSWWTRPDSQPDAATRTRQPRHRREAEGSGKQLTGQAAPRPWRPRTGQVSGRVH